MSAHRDLQDLQLAPFEVPDPGSGNPINVDRWNMVVPIVTGAGAETNTLPVPIKAGLRVRLTLKTAGGGTRTVTAASAINIAGNTTMAFTEARDNILLESIPLGSAYAWEVIQNNAVTLG